MPNVDNESEDGAWKRYIVEVRNILNIDEIDYPPKEDEEE